jgi:hypothetical protein
MDFIFTKILLDFDENTGSGFLRRLLVSIPYTIDIYIQIKKKEE